MISGGSTVHRSEMHGRCLVEDSSFVSSSVLTGMAVVQGRGYVQDSLVSGKVTVSGATVRNSVINSESCPLVFVSGAVIDGAVIEDNDDYLLIQGVPANRFLVQVFRTESGCRVMVDDNPIDFHAGVHYLSLSTLIFDALADLGVPMGEDSKVVAGVLDTVSAKVAELLRKAEKMPTEDDYDAL